MKLIKKCVKNANRMNEEGNDYAQYLYANISEQLGVSKKEVSNYAVCLLSELITELNLGREIRAGKKHFRMSSHFTSKKMEMPPGADW